jgi:hypothetical protein
MDDGYVVSNYLIGIQKSEKNTQYQELNKITNILLVEVATKDKTAGESLTRMSLKEENNFWKCQHFPMDKEQ